MGEVYRARDTRLGRDVAEDCNSGTYSEDLFQPGARAYANYGVLDWALSSVDT